MPKIIQINNINIDIDKLTNIITNLSPEETAVVIYQIKKTPQLSNYFNS